MRILQTANVVAPEASAVATTLRALAHGYRSAGHVVTRVVPGTEHRREMTADAEVITVRARRVPGTGYRMITDNRRMLRMLDDVRPDRIEVSDRFTAQAVGRWAQRHGVPTVVLPHERLDAVLATYVRSPRLARFMADFWNLRLVVSFDTVVCATDWAREEFTRLGVENLVRIRPGVDLATFHPDHASAALRRRLVPDGAALLVTANRLVAEKQPQLAIDTVRALRGRGVPAHLVMAGDGPLREACRRRAADLPVRFLGHVADRGRLARLLATADVVLAPGAAETFGLAALEALASGTPVVGHQGGALPELLDVTAGAVTAGDPDAFATAALRLMATDEGSRRAAARAHAERFGWPGTVAQMLAVHQAAVPRAA